MSKSLSRPLITLATDFGLQGSYVGQMKGTILARNPAIKLVDLSHQIPPQNVLAGALLLADCCPRFPRGTIHVAVVDPGVGTDRRMVCAKIDGQVYVAPDNGLLTYVLRDASIESLIAITNRTYFGAEVSPTFHGRDIFAPVAAHLSLGLNPARLGKKLDPRELRLLPVPEAIVAEGEVTGEILDIDSFGNLISNIEQAQLPQPAPIPNAVVRCGGQEVAGIQQTYGDAPPRTLVALMGSSGRLELAVVNGSAAAETQISVGTRITVSVP